MSEDGGGKAFGQYAKCLLEGIAIRIMWEQQQEMYSSGGRMAREEEKNTKSGNRRNKVKSALPGELSVRPQLHRKWIAIETNAMGSEESNRGEETKRTFGGHADEVPL